MKLFFVTLSSWIFLFSQLDADYNELFEKFPHILGPCGSQKQGEIEIATEPDVIKQIETACRERLIAKGYSYDDAVAFSKTGIITEDQYLVMIRDAVWFPGQVPGTYDRILWKSGLAGAAGAVVLPLLSDGRIVLNLHFRHATRKWELELPRGMRERNETAHMAAKRELREETGYESSEEFFLGNIAPDTGLIGNVVPVYLAKIHQARMAPKREKSEAIAKNVFLSKKEIYDAFIQGFIKLEICGEIKKVYCRDPFLAFALLQMQLRGL